MADRFDALNGYRKGSPRFAELEVLAVDRVGRDELTDADARREGFETLAELLEALEVLYPGRAPLMRVRFRAV
jgi:hypothetical protein